MTRRVSGGWQSGDFERDDRCCYERDRADQGPDLRPGRCFARGVCRNLGTLIGAFGHRSPQAADAQDFPAHDLPTQLLAVQLESAQDLPVQADEAHDFPAHDSLAHDLPDQVDPAQDFPAHDLPLHDVAHQHVSVQLLPAQVPPVHAVKLALAAAHLSAWKAPRMVRSPVSSTPLSLTCWDPRAFSREPSPVDRGQVWLVVGAASW